MKLKTTLSLAILAAAAIAGAAKTYDVVMATRDAQGRLITANIDRNDVAEAQKIFREGKNPQKLLDIAARRRAKSPAGSEEGEGFKVTFTVEDGTTPPEGYLYTFDKVYVTQGGQYGHSYYNYAYHPQEEDGWWGCYVPEGTYYVILRGCLLKDDYSRENNIYVVKTDVDIKSDMTITFRMSDAKNLLTADFSFPDGIKMDREDDNYYSFFRCLNNSDGGFCCNFTMQGCPNDTIYINDLDDRWTYAINHVGVTPKGSYVNKLVERGPFTSSRHFTNNPSDYVESSTRFEPILTTDSKINGHGVTTEMTWQGINWDAPAGGAMVFEGDYSGEVKFWINNKRSDMSATTGFDVFVSPVVIEHIDTIDYGDFAEYDLAVATGSLMISESTGAPYTFISDKGYKHEDYEEETFFLPTVSPFDYIADTHTFLKAAPLLDARSFSNFHNEYLGKDFLFLEYDITYPGFEHTYLPILLTVTNGDKTASIMREELWDWCNEGNYTPGPTTFEMSATYAKDGETERRTISRYSFDSAGKEENFAVPSVEIYQLRDAEGDYTDEAIQKGSLIFGVNKPNVTVSAEYAAEGSGNWNSFEVEDLGNCYKAALADIDDSLIDKRLDLRFSVSDAEGNSAVQTIEGAFVFRLEAGLSDIAEDGEVVSTICYNLQGQRVPADCKDIVIRISTMADGTVRTARVLNR